MNKRTFRKEIARLVRDCRADIQPDYRACEDSDVPGMQLTIGASAKGWSFQTGDNSFTGGAYGYATWAVASVYRDSNSFAVADDIIEQLIDVAPNDAPIFGGRS